MGKSWYGISFFICLALISSVFWYCQVPLCQWSNTATAVFMSPLLKAQHALLAPMNQYYRSGDRVSAERSLRELEQERDDLLSELIALRSAQEFMRETVELQQYRRRYKTDICRLAHVMLKHLNDHEQYVLVDQGSAHGVHKDMVAVYKNALVGRVTQVYPHWSKVVLITDPLCKVAVTCMQTKASGIAEGVCKRDCFTVTHVNHLDRIKEGDYIISSGAGLVFPKGFGLGTVLDYTQEGLFYTVTAKPLIPIDRIEYCYLLTKGSSL